MKEAFLAAAALAACYFAFRYLALRKALRQAERELQEIQRELSQNRFLHLPSPDSALERLIGTVNGTLAEIRRERLSYEKRERAFQRQIENISHDLRTPLTVILGYLQLLKGAEPAEPLIIVERNARAMERLVAQFYTYSQLCAQDYKRTLQRVDANRLLRETLAANYQTLSQARLEVSCELPEHPAAVWGDEEALERIFSNLLQNAGRYAASVLYIGLEEREDEVLISFANDTDRVSERDVPHLFERFYMQDPARSQGGSGLGLTVAKGLAEAMEGELTAELLTESGRPEAARGMGAAAGRKTLCFRVRLRRG